HEFQFRKHNESWIRIIWRDLITETEVFDRSVKLCRVKGSNLDPKKLWYVLTESLCGIRPNAFAKSEISCQFPNEIWSVPPAGLKPAKNGCLFNTRQPGNSYVVSSFGLCAGLLRQREFPAHGFVRSQNIIPVVNAVNGMALNFEIADSLGGKYLMEVMSKCQSRIAELDHEIRELERSIDAEKAKVSETISEVVNLVMDAHGVKKGVTDLLLPTTY
ncbi:hypothetical protein pdam_00025352, partial [Pocillopora damicornis]